MVYGWKQHENDKEATLNWTTWTKGNIMFNGCSADFPRDCAIVNRVELCQNILYALEYIEQHVSIRMDCLLLFKY